MGNITKIPTQCGELIIKDHVLINYYGTDTDLVMPQDVWEIGDNAFGRDKSGNRYENNTLVTIDLNNIREIGRHAFSQYYTGVFQFCKKLTAINVSPENERYTSVDGVLYNKEMTKLFRYPAGKAVAEFVVPDTVTGIAAYSFYGSENLEGIFFPDTLKTIGLRAFEDCIKLKEVIIPDTVTMIWDMAFSRCAELAKVKLPNNSEYREIQGYTFFLCNKLKCVSIPEGIRKIGYHAFEYCQSLEKITIPEKTFIDERAFAHCESISYIDNKTRFSILPAFADSKYVQMIGRLKDERYITELAKYATYGDYCDAYRFYNVMYSLRCDDSTPLAKYAKNSAYINYDDAYKFYIVMYSLGYDSSTPVEKLIKDSNTNLTKEQGEELISFNKWVRYAIYGEIQ